MDSYEAVSIRHAGQDGGGRGQALEGSSLATTAETGPRCVRYRLFVSRYMQPKGS